MPFYTLNSVLPIFCAGSVIFRYFYVTASCLKMAINFFCFMPNIVLLFLKNIFLDVWLYGQY